MDFHLSKCDKRVYCFTHSTKSKLHRSAKFPRLNRKRWPPRFRRIPRTCDVLDGHSASIHTRVEFFKLAKEDPQANLPYSVWTQLQLFRVMSDRLSPIASLVPTYAVSEDAHYPQK